MLKVKDLKVTINTDKGPLKVVDGLSFELKKGMTLGIVGESGAGKTMTALSLLRLSGVKDIKGKVIYSNKELQEKDFKNIRGKEIGLILQNPSAALNPSLTIGWQLEECIDNGLGAIELLKKVGISDPEERLHNYPHQLSGGMKQRIILAMALAKKPKILIADEPTTGLDVTVQAQMLELLDDIKKTENLSLILIAHDMGIVARMCDQVLVMYAGRPVEYGPVDRIFYHTVHPYTKGLLNSVSRLSHDKRNRLRPIGGNPPDLYRLSKGCYFAPRCPDVKEVCKSKTPVLKKIDKNHYAVCHLED